jgi:1-acyl-sn-glycerol-3-phosphate acyltransferase
MTLDFLFKNVFSRLLFKSFGSYPAFRGQGIQKALEIPDKLLRQGGVVVFFPEGKCIRNDELSCSRPGAGILASRFPTVPILPIAIFGTHKVLRSAFRLHRQKIVIRIGEPFYFADKLAQVGSDPNGGPSAILMAEIEKIYKQIV